MVRGPREEVAATVVMVGTALLFIEGAADTVRGLHGHHVWAVYVHGVETVLFFLAMTWASMFLVKARGSRRRCQAAAEKPSRETG